MADIRINSLPTTASASSSDDFLALDGATNGTRKLNAYSPTFGGNLTVSGTGTSSVAGTIDVGTLPTSGRDVPIVAGFYQSSDYVHAIVVGRGGVANPQQLSLGVNQASTYSEIQATQAGVATNKLILNRQGGNVLIGTTTDNGQKLQVSGSALIYAASNTHLKLDNASDQRYTSIYFNNGGVQKAGLYWDNATGTVFLDSQAGSSSIKLHTSNTLALTLNSSQNATFAGNLTVSGTGRSNFAGNLGVEADNTSGGARLIIRKGSDVGAGAVVAVGLDSLNDAENTVVPLAIRGTPITLVGATTVTSNLTVNGTVQIDGFSALFKTPTATLATIGSAYAAGHGSYRAEISFGAQNFGSTDGGYIGFRTSATYNTGTLSEVGRFAASGNFLIGTTTDNGFKLQVAGGATFSGEVASTKANSNSAGTAALSFKDGYNSFRQDTSFGFNLDQFYGGSFKQSLNITDGNATFAGKIFASPGVNTGGLVLTGFDTSGDYVAVGGQYASNNTGHLAQVRFYSRATGGTASSIAFALTSSGSVVETLLLNTDQSATFAGKVTANGAGSTFKGTATNDSAAAGYMGEYAETSTVYASRITLTTDTVANVASVSLTAGDWDVSGNVELEMSGVTSTDKRSGVSTTSASLTNNPDTCGVIDLPTTTLTGYLTIPTPTVRISIASTTTVYLPTKVTFSAGTTKAWGIIRARRVR